MSFGPDSAIDRGHVTPPHEQLAEILRARIRRGDYQPDRAIPSVGALMQEFGAGRETVRKALTALQAEGWIKIIKGRGAYVLPDAPV